MKILIVGATQGSNFGDYLFAQMFQDCISRLIGIENTFFYRNCFTFSSFYADHLKNRNKCSVKEVDAIIYMSGGYFCGDDINIKSYICRFFRYVWVGLKGIMLKKPIAIIAVEVGPTNCWILKRTEKILFDRARLLIVRNNESSEYVNIICKKKVNSIVTADSVFAMKKSFFSDKEIPYSVSSCTKKKMFLHISPYYGHNAVIIEKIIPIVRHFIERHSEYQLFIGTDQYSPKQLEAIEEVKKYMPGVNVVSLNYSDPIALCQVLDNMDLIITYKLHVGIVGAHLGKSVISFSGHTEKIKRLYRQLGIDFRSLSLEHLTFEKGCKMLEEYHNINISIPQKIVDIAETNFVMLSDFIASLQKEI